MDVQKLRLREETEEKLDTGLRCEALHAGHELPMATTAGGGGDLLDSPDAAERKKAQQATLAALPAKPREALQASA